MAQRDLVIAFALSIGILLLSQRLHLPAIAGLLLTGAIVGPYGIGLLHDVEVVTGLVEVGIVLLLSIIGIEFFLNAFLSLKRTVGLSATVQVGLSLPATYAAAHLLGRPDGEALRWGFLAALSSTPIVVKLLEDCGGIAAKGVAPT